MGEDASAGPVAVTITNLRGLHARASAKFVTLASSFSALVTVGHDGHEVPGTSIMGLMMLAAGPGDVITLSATGPDAAEAINRLTGLINDKFGED